VLSGNRVERRESGAPGAFEKIEQMTADELVAFLQQPDTAHTGDGSVH